MKGNYKHGHTHTRLYNIWKSMRQRCINPNNSRYANYGARGISICREWENFQNFYEWAISSGYNDKLSIDRKDVNGNYEPSNCKLSTYIQQANNKSNNKNITHDGVTHTLAEWARIAGIKTSTLHHRLKHGWSFDDAITIKPVRGSNQTLRKAGG